MRALRLLLAFAFTAYTLNVPELLHAMDAQAHIAGHDVELHVVEQEHVHSHDAEHSHAPASEAPGEAEHASHEHWHCLSCVSGVQVLDQAPDLSPVAGRLSPAFVPPQFVPTQPSTNIFHPPA